MNWLYVATSVISFYANYIGLSVVLVYYYYIKNWDRREWWKIQPEKLPIDVRNRPKSHLIYWFINTLFGASNAVISYHITMKNQYIQRDIYQQISNVILLHAAHTIFSYFWHRALHIPILYKNFHKIHHHYKSPMPFDDLFFHPVEYAVYGWFLLIPLFLFNLTPLEIILYLTPLGLLGMYILLI
eukprot:NODE_85_length_22232_cov_1.318619.p15 type:complete len:185 gc:universal NODE_85_length_22232_cov_1.318619:10745-11299(+)